MKLVLQRTKLLPTKTLGNLSIDGKFYCFTLEDTLRPEGVKVKGQTAIPAGIYKVCVTWSNRFRKPLPQILDVPGFDGIRLHGGNTDADTEGCVLVGFNLDASRNIIYRSASAQLTTMLTPKLSKEISKTYEPITIEIRNPEGK